jgi:hypothetical protein
MKRALAERHERIAEAHRAKDEMAGAAEAAAAVVAGLEERAARDRAEVQAITQVCARALLSPFSRATPHLGSPPAPHLP